jgi:phage terminase large subunit-like protein
MSQANLRDLIRLEYKKCIENPIYFMKKYVKIQHPIRGTINFDLFEFQEKALEDLTIHDFNIILKSRQMGISTLVAAYSLWLMIFHNDKNILCISITQETSKEIVTRVRFANDNLPSWLKVQCVEDNRLSLRLKNGSQIKAASSSGTAGRSAAISLLCIDECCAGDTKIKIRNKHTGEIKKIEIEDLFDEKYT